jgi:hypothetical protein
MSKHRGNAYAWKRNAGGGPGYGATGTPPGGWLKWLTGWLR